VWGARLPAQRYATRVNPIKIFTFAALAALAALLPVSAHADDGGAGHYAPGAKAAFIDVLPGKPNPQTKRVFTCANETSHPSGCCSF
jgi:hypothetical protein